MLHCRRIGIQRIANTDRVCSMKTWTMFRLRAVKFCQKLMKQSTNYNPLIVLDQLPLVKNNALSKLDPPVKNNALSKLRRLIK